MTCQMNDSVFYEKIKNYSYLKLYINKKHQGLRKNDELNYKLLEHYKSKYGNGKGSNYRYTYSRGEYGEKGYVFECKEKEDRMWANERVTMKYEHYWDQRTATDERQRVYGSTSCVISSNDRYDDFLNELNKHKKAYKELKEAKTQASYDSL